MDLNDALKQGAARTVAGGGAQRVRGALVVAEIAFSVVLLAGAGLLIKSFQTLQSMPLGFRPERVLVMEADVPALDLNGRRRAVEFYRDLIADAAATPGVEAAAGARTPPGRVMSNGGYWIDNLPEQRTMAAPQAVFSVVSPGVFNTLKIPLRSGRDFNAGDTYEAPSTIVINESLARRSFAGRDRAGPHHVLRL